MKKNLRFIIPAAAILLLTLIFGIMYIVSSNGNGEKNDGSSNTETASSTTDSINTSVDYKVGIMQFDSTSEYTDVYEEFVLAMEQRGFSQGINVSYILENAEGDSGKCQTMAETLVNSDVDLIFAISEENAVAAYAATKDIPIVFGAVTDPEEAGLIDTNEVPGTNVTGVSDYSPSMEQMDLIKNVFPEAKTVAVIYDELSESSVMQVSLAETQAQENGIVLEKYPISEATDLISLTKEITEKAQVIYLPYDELLIKNIEKITSVAYEKGIPVVGGNEEMVIKGCTIAYGIDYSDVGKQSALMAVEILSNDGNPAEMPVRYLNELILYVNSQAKEKLSFTLEQSLEDKSVYLTPDSE